MSNPDGSAVTAVWRERDAGACTPCQNRYARSRESNRIRSVIFFKGIPALVNIQPEDMTFHFYQAELVVAVIVVVLKYNTKSKNTLILLGRSTTSFSHGDMGQHPRYLSRKKTARINAKR